MNVYSFKPNLCHKAGKFFLFKLKGFEKLLELPFSFCLSFFTSRKISAKKFSLFLLTSCCLLLTLPSASSANSIDDAINNGLTWLVAQQNTAENNLKGSFGSPNTAQVDTYESFKTFTQFNNNVGARRKILQWFQQQKRKDADFIARKLEALSAFELEIQNLIDELINQQNEDGGWGLSAKYESAPFHTLTVFNAFTYFDLPGRGLVPSATMDAAVNYLAQTKNPSGYWVLGSEEEGNVALTASILLALTDYALSSYDPNPQLNSMITKASSWLRSQQNPDGSWGNSADTSATSLCFSALTRAMFIDNSVTVNLGPTSAWLLN